ncbi:S-adenosylmethionine--tRNA ribosyltransferase-isomerase [Thermosyntropha lipolytica DSM 11003]|uniref:S-adenosylmethionine:tRNA ribosyltransferase-isomerase n=1 Tax=Thermosyntropha lipolytica DSM 11003 TaxID=1123382 RepID=A0A1M5P9J8_9FIRM|nr:tRNA preQ1(34) S-adenosylmethionine ribosyltransferase-isomerase QueA [Thermosyntropha lipolytica]SHG98446.1 S-adenosylmethionine--tRNA ribosyltransferase-isomerase [Thermosyntropha lipolytica DSM 11003]
MNDKSYDIYHLKSYDYYLPEDLIAKFPVEPRDASRLLVLDRRTGRVEDKIFRDIIEYLKPGDTLVVNKTRVIPARLHGYKESGGKVEILLLKKRDEGWEALVRPAKRLRPGETVFFGEGVKVTAEIVDVSEVEGGRIIRFNNCPDDYQFIEEMGEMPLPPYIRRSAEESDKRRYQTVYAQETGSAAAPTAGLHFTEKLLYDLQAKGVNIAGIVLHVGIGTFRPVTCENIREHKMHREWYRIDEETARLLNNTRQEGRSIVAVGTTVVRTLETVYNDDYGFRAESGETEKFIYPGYKFKAVDKLITNFHLPGSSLLMLVAAFAGYENTMAAYRYAVENRYRFFSYGDAMFIK